MSVAVVVPAYNEEGFVGEVIDDLPSFVDRAYVVDDGSTDGTWREICDRSEIRNAAHDGHFDELVVPIRHESNRGVGGAIKTGYQRAREEEIDATAVLGGDDQMNPDVLRQYLDPIADGAAEYTKGNRFARPEDWAEMPRFRLVGNVILSYLTKVASGYWETMDSQNGYTAISLQALRDTDIEGMYEYYGYCNDLLVRLNAADVRIADVPRSSEYAYTEGWKSHIDYTEYIPRVSGMLFRSFLWRLRRKYLLTSYNPVAPMYLLGMTVLGASLLGLVRSVVSRDGDSGSWMLSSTVGVLALFHATVLDREDNEHLETRIESDEAITVEDGPQLGPGGTSNDGESGAEGESFDDQRDTPAGTIETRNGSADESGNGTLPVEE